MAPTTHTPNARPISNGLPGRLKDDESLGAPTWKRNQCALTSATIRLASESAPAAGNRNGFPARRARRDVTPLREMTGDMMEIGRRSDLGSAFKRTPLAGGLQYVELVRIDGRRLCIVGGDRGAAVSGYTAAPPGLGSRSRKGSGLS